GTEDRDPFFEIPFLSVLENYGTRRVFSLGVVQTGTDVPKQEVFLRIGRNDTWNLTRIDDYGALLLENRNRLFHHLHLSRIQTATRLFLPRWRDLVIKECPWNSNACSL